MPAEDIGPINFVQEWWDAIKTSPRLQMLIVFVPIIGIVVVCLFRSCWREHKQELAQAAQVEQQRIDKEKQIAEDTQRAKEQEERQAAETARLAKEKEEQQQKAQEEYVRSIKALFALPAGRLSQGTVVLSISAQGLSQELRDTFSANFETQLKKYFPTNNINSGAVSLNFYSQGYFDKVFAGDTEPLKTAEFFDHADKLLLVKPSATFRSSETVSGLKICSLTVAHCSYNLAAERNKRGSFSASGSGYSEQAALTEAIEELVKTNNGEIKNLLEGNP